eukprot:TRINITY_DN33969_c0_g1_i1.p1 TRINITY_DN33969_c0_g1~~TRINITY_DN33969_c0_g1_i1.p1  ORF type:complete len:393 (+),score=48.58 TRINITY_DN33969_c0_g1_i1:36-1214(+)
MVSPWRRGTQISSRAGHGMFFLFAMIVTVSWLIPVTFSEPFRVRSPDSSRRQLSVALGLATFPLIQLPEVPQAASDSELLFNSIEDKLTEAAAMTYNTENRLMYNTAKRAPHDPFRALTCGDFIRSLPDKCVVCVGEEHDHPLHHAAELQLLESLRAATPRSKPLALGLEMFVQCDEHRRALDDFALGKISLDVLQQRTNWSETWGYPILYYAELLNYARDHDIQLVPLNCPLRLSTFAKILGVQGFIGQPSMPYIDLSNREHRSFFMEEFFGNSVNKLPADLVQRQYEAQTMREEFMAAGAAAHLKTVGGRLMMISGRSHVSRRHGIPDRIIRRLDKSFSPPITLLLQSVDWCERHGSLSGQIPVCKKLPETRDADWVWFTERKKGFPTPF